MTIEQSSEYMRNVKWTTAGIVLSSTISVIIAIVWFCSDIKSDIKDTRVASHEEYIQSKEQTTALRVAFFKAIDSVQMINNNNFRDIWDAVNNKGQAPRITHVVRMVGGCAIQQIINGKRVYIPVKCQ